MNYYKGRSAIQDLAGSTKQMAQQRVVFRVDASRQIGTGHVMRCLFLAEQLRRDGAWVAFICRMHEGHLGGLIESKGFALRLLKVQANYLSGAKALENWLGASWETDFEETAKCLHSFGKEPDWLVVDHYAIDYRWERRISDFAKNVFVVDDLADRRHHCDFLLDQNLVEDWKNRYFHLINPECKLLLGPTYALLQAEYAKIHNEVSLKNGKIKRIFIYFGGGDVSASIAKVLESIVLLEKHDIEIDLILGSGASMTPLESFIKAIPAINVHQNLQTLSSIMIKADLAIGACGVTTWERMCLGLPSLVMTVADNQEKIAEYLHNNYLVFLLGRAGELSVAEIKNTLARIIDNGIDKMWSKRCHELVDGRGVNRVSTVLLLNATSNLFLRKVNEVDESLMLEWANDPETRKNAFCSSSITPEVHHKWFSSHLKDSNCHMYIIQTRDGIPIGQVRFQKIKATLYEIHYSLDCFYRGRRIGESLLRTAINYFSTRKYGMNLVAKVLVSNIASQKTFERLNFIKCEQMSSGETLYYHLKTSL